MTATYEKRGVRFMYPANWQISEDNASPSQLGVSVQSPGSGFWSLTRYPAATDPASLVEQVVTTMRAEYDTLESIETPQSLDDVACISRELNFYCLDLLVTAVASSFPCEDHVFVVLCQAENREFEELREVFRAITLSLVRAATDVQ